MVSFGGPDVGLLCAAGKVRTSRLRLRLAGLAPFYDPRFAEARSRRSGSRSARWTKAWCVADCRPRHSACRSCRFAPVWAFGRLLEASYTRSPARSYPRTTDARRCSRCRRCALDAAFVHLNRADARQCGLPGLDPYFDDLFLMAAERRFLSVRARRLDR